LKTDVNKVNEVIDEGYTSPFAFTITIKPFMRLSVNQKYN